VHINFNLFFIRVWCVLDSGQHDVSGLQSTHVLELLVIFALTSSSQIVVFFFIIIAMVGFEPSYYYIF
jgi:hypothetical protein